MSIFGRFKLKSSKIISPLHKLKMFSSFHTVSTPSGEKYAGEREKTHFNSTEKRYTGHANNYLSERYATYEKD